MTKYLEIMDLRGLKFPPFLPPGLGTRIFKKNQKFFPQKKGGECPPSPSGKIGKKPPLFPGKHLRGGPLAAPIEALFRDFNLGKTLGRKIPSGPGGGLSWKLGSHGPNNQSKKAGALPPVGVWPKGGPGGNFLGAPPHWGRGGKIKKIS